MKKKWLVILLITVLAIMPGIFTWVIKTDVTAKAVSTSMTTQDWQVSFSVALKKDKIIEDYVYVTTDKGEKVPATIDLLKDRKTLVVKSMEAGSYQLHVKKRRLTMVLR